MRCVLPSLLRCSRQPQAMNHRMMTLNAATVPMLGKKATGTVAGTGITTSPSSCSHQGSTPGLIQLLSQSLLASGQWIDAMRIHPFVLILVSLWVILTNYTEAKRNMLGIYYHITGQEVDECSL
jgi:hypothetical protein